MDRIRILRNKKNITQLRLATEIGVTQETISSYELGKAEPKFSKLVEIANYLNTSTDYLLERTDDDSSLIDLANNIVDNELNELINTYARLNKLQRKDLIWYSECLKEKDQ
jgi:transcriptional regulator with XRE-family HTH domain